ncbi:MULTISPECIES: low molecular weight phosphatase family protein [unclassified Microbacterium]|uniref:arsenate reductase/protein-tyrosine-phosphatase family protein n=1 Tax=unclassified Microbacterium TaxID=2609290 RepID=UPI00214B17DD|nr:MULTISPECIES: low molecular weight phosphatase family protein [unclassified Microbacterium]MCR2808907.1 low molecular weight phosphatase family protein [Microbacterium sp. zg.B185]WIM18674.1 low molecular weight phosphatase family protein [Microbacterium sp. zg-B185]
MFDILTVCTGNIARSPLAEQLLRARLAPLEGKVHSAGTSGLRAVSMTPEAVEMARRLGIPAMDSAAHRSRYLTEAMLESPDLILTMTREHRRLVAELAPSRLRSTFTVREFARLATTVADDELRAAADTVGSEPAARVRAAAAAVASQRGMLPPPVDPADDDVIDPYKRRMDVYERSANELDSAIDEVVRVLRVVLA